MYGGERRGSEKGGGGGTGGGAGAKGAKKWQASADRWTHDRFDESEQAPKSQAELVFAYGYDIRSEDGPPKARRKRRYARGPNRYTRNWEDEDAYQKSSGAEHHQRHKKLPRPEEFPELAGGANGKSGRATGRAAGKARRRVETGSEGSPAGRRVVLLLVVVRSRPMCGGRVAPGRTARWAVRSGYGRAIGLRVRPVAIVTGSRSSGPAIGSSGPSTEAAMGGIATRSAARATIITTRRTSSPAAAGEIVRRRSTR